ncbi:receptor-transporting protein 3 [Exaiptasia diaphana]|uniref:3CxxC-type domain-containing protein n=1 Tax=Exaiptasia diaphana TaxID=2652724 RepID=A0A913Y9L0_EXADI|nr:receptor-transporting protein 3 [Exaiptasia diaphana]
MMADLEPHLNLKTFWYDTFNATFNVFDRDEWHLEPTNTEMTGSGWYTYQDKAKVKFVCSDCGRSWTSMKGVVIFWFQLNKETHKGNLRFKLFGQKCNSNCTDTFQKPRWYREEIEKVLSNILQKIGEKFYSFKPKESDTKTRQGRPRKPHNTSMCEACQMGVCNKSRG